MLACCGVPPASDSEVMPRNRTAVRLRETVEFESSRKKGDLASVLPPGEKKPVNDSKRDQLKRTLSNISGQDMTRALTKVKLRSTISTLDWHKPTQTAIIFDWDDTLFPTSWLKAQSGLKWYEPLPNNSPYKSIFQNISNNIRDVLETAAELGSVSIVTLASSPWVTIAVRNFLPELEAMIVNLGIPVAYAREELLPGDDALGSEEVSRMLKRRAMNRVIKKFYSQYVQQSWKNVISIGDSVFERQALQDVVSFKKQDASKKCRAKTLKLADAPDVDQLNAQMTVLATWLRPMVMYDDHIDIDLDGNLDDVLKWQRRFAETTQPLSRAGST
jgi:hypothetical protein